MVGPEEEFEFALPMRAMKTLLEGEFGLNETVPPTGG